MSGNFLTIPGDEPLQRRSRSSSLTDLISAFDNKAQAHTDLQKVTAFSGQFDKNYKPTFSKEEYGKPVPGSMTELRGAEAQARVQTEMKELCEIINQYGKPPCKSLLPPELQQATKVISFGELFSNKFEVTLQRYYDRIVVRFDISPRASNCILDGIVEPFVDDDVDYILISHYIYTIINDKLVGLLLRTRKHHLTYFEGEVLFQKQDDDVPVFLMQTIDDIRTYCNNKALQARRSVSPMPQ